MRCHVCKGDFEERLIRYVQDYKRMVVIIENVPAHVCTQCSEQVLRPEVVDKIQQIVWKQPAPKRKAAVPVYDLADVA
ncbi:MAG: YgiT-type zinc finger protein [Dehalococcoidia bacterium]